MRPLERPPGLIGGTLIDMAEKTRKATGTVPEDVAATGAVPV
jgi:hypothetical protein